MTENSATGGVISRIEGRVCWITIDCPPLNIMSTKIFRDLESALKQADAEPHVAVVVLQGAGDRAFSSGANIGDHTPEAEEEHHAALFDLMARLAHKDAKPRIAAVQGYCYGGGIEVAFGCDIVVACENARFSMPEIGLGIFAGIGARMLMKHIVPARAFELAASGEKIDARRAYELGMVGRLLPQEGFANALADYVSTFANHSASALSIGRAMFQESAGLGEIEAIEFLRHELAGRGMKTADYREGMASYLEKRKPRWSDA